MKVGMAEMLKDIAKKKAKKDKIALLQQARTVSYTHLTLPTSG